MKNNTTLKILIGVSASGKSTWAKDFVAKNDKWCIVSRDDYRYAWQNKGVVDSKLEQIITVQVKNAIESLIGSGYSVIYDATNLKASYIKNIAEYVKHTATVEYQIFDVPKDVCIQRDNLRERKVGAEVIERQFENYLNLTKTFNFTPTHPTPKIYNNPDYDSNKKYAVIVDIDGTLAHTNGKRSHYDMTKVELDVCDVAVRSVVNILSDNYDILLVTGRDEFCRVETYQWAIDNGIKFNKLYMRPEGDIRKDSLVKTDIYLQHIDPNYNVVCVLDDRQQVVDMWRGLGLKCLQVQEGNF